ncbi:unnamed protein product [Enterobius vermicularis]|uniref:HECT domain-containing protein n=1 Tax=Enterobius vermicularis TaxID=51028 RepID=A0A0N4VGA5_ENTVE|nr:unnamed protein product [Enterobius vermicularis]
MDDAGSPEDDWTLDFERVFEVILLIIGQYNFDIDDLSTVVKEPEVFLRINATTEVLETHSVGGFIDCCYPLPVR